MIPGAHHPRCSSFRRLPPRTRDLLFAGFVGVSFGPHLADSQNPQFRTEVHRVFVDTFVTRNGRPVSGLRVEDFEVLDNGRLQETVILLRAADHPLSVVLVLDTSASVQGARLERLRDAARDFIQNLSEEDEVSLISFGTRYRMVQSFTRNHVSAQESLNRMSGGGATGLLDALFAAALHAEQGRGRPLVLLFSDGEDNASWLSTERLVRTARRSEAVIFAVRAASGAGIHLGVTDSTPPSFLESPRDEVSGRMLETITGATGGRRNLARIDDGPRRGLPCGSRGDAQPISSRVRTRRSDYRMARSRGAPEARNRGRRPGSGRLFRQMSCGAGSCHRDPQW